MSSSPCRRALHGATVLGIVAGTALAAATPALAHVTAQTTEARQGAGGGALLRTRRPEREGADR